MKRILSVVMLANLLHATNVEIIKKDKSKTYNQVDDSYSDEKGFAFYEDLKHQKALKKNKKKEECCKELLKVSKEILKENKIQTKIQTKILKLLESQFDPKPKKIIVNGKECIENSSAECFKMPLTPEAKKYPALAMWMQNPSMQNTVNFLQWEAKYFKEIYKRGNSLPMATTQFGDKAYPLPNKTIGYTDILGFGEKSQQIKNFMEQVNKEYSYLIFFGLNKDLDTVSVYEIYQLLKKYPKLDMSFVFLNKESKELFEQALKVLFSPNMIKQINKNQIVVSKKTFKTYNIYTTPAIVAVNKKEKEANTLTIGRIQVSYFEENMYNLLEYKDKLDYKKFMNHKTWNKNVNYRDVYYKNKIGIDINSFMDKKGNK